MGWNTKRFVFALVLVLLNFIEFDEIKPKLPASFLSKLLASFLSKLLASFLLKLPASFLSKLLASFLPYQ